MVAPDPKRTVIKSPLTARWFALSNLCILRPLLGMAYPVIDRRASDSSPEGGHRLDPDVPIETTDHCGSPSTKVRPAIKWTSPTPLPLLSGLTTRPAEL